MKKIFAIFLLTSLLGVLLIILFAQKKKLFVDDIDQYKAYSITNEEKLIGHNSTLLWQGFYHQWSINHRLNRLGDMIEDVEVTDSVLSAKLIHTAASGSAADVLDYTSFFSYIKTNNASFASSNVNFQIYGLEGKEVTNSIKVKGFFEDKLNDYSNAVVVLNGIDVRSSSEEELVYGNGKADKLIAFKTSLDNLSVKDGQYEFDVDLKFNGDCDSPECLRLNGKKNKWFDYQVKVGYQIIFYNENVGFEDVLVSNNYTWDKRKGKKEAALEEIYRENLGYVNKSIHIEKGYTHVISMISSIDIDIPKATRGKEGAKGKAVHLLALDMALPNFEFNAVESICTFNVCLFFKNWTYKMHPLSNTFNGTANLKMGVKLLQLDDINAEVESHQYSDKITWKTSHLKQNPSTNIRSFKEKLFTKELY